MISRESKKRFSCNTGFIGSFEDYRTKRHLDFFKKDEEAEFFGLKEEFLEKVKRFLADEGAWRRIAETGRARCFSSDYSHRVQLTKMLAEVLLIE